VLSGHSSWVRIIAFSPNGKTLASGAPGTTDRAVRLWDIQSGQQNAVLGHARCVYSIAFCPDGDMLVSGAENGTVHLWESGTGNNLAVLGSHAGCLHTVTFSPDGGLVASGGSEGQVSLWRVVWVHKADVMRREREQEVQSQKEVEQWRKESKESDERMLMEREKKQQEDWLSAGCCIKCGEKLGAVDKMRGKKTCKQHRLWE
jgi:WD40 repeat protein